jgi:hypothetical protein
MKFRSPQSEAIVCNSLTENILFSSKEYPCFILFIIVITLLFFIIECIKDRSRGWIRVANFNPLSKGVTSYLCHTPW